MTKIMKPGASLSVIPAQRISKIVAKEILALRRIGSNPYCGLSSLGGSGMWEFDRYFVIELCDDKLTAMVDFYSQHFDLHADDREAWDVDVWDAEKLHLESALITRKHFLGLYSVVRALLNGRTVTFSDGSVFSRDLHMASVRTGMEVLETCTPITEGQPS